MKYLSWFVFGLFVASGLLSGCAPANNFAGTWTMNLGKVNFVQNGNEITGAIDGYGGNWKENFQGTVNGKEANINTNWFGNFTLVINGNQIKSKSPDPAFCGIRSVVTEELPKGCGFSGKWILPSKNTFPKGTYMLLMQTAQNVTGDLYDGNGKMLDSVKGSVNWGKGWMMYGTTTQQGDITFYMNSSETGFEIVFGNSSNKQQLCAVREGQTSAYIMYFTCQP